MRTVEGLEGAENSILDLVRDAQELLTNHPSLAVAAAFGLLVMLVITWLYYSQLRTLRALRLEVKALKDQQPLTDQLIDRVLDSELDDHPIIEELRSILAVEAVRRVNLSASSDSASELRKALIPRLDRIILREVELLDKRSGDRVGKALQEPLIEATLERLTRTRDDRQSTLWNGLYSVLDSVIVAKAGELGESMQLQYELQDQLAETLANEVVHRLNTARKNRASDPLWAQANPVFEGLILDVTNGLSAEDLTPKLKPIVLDYAGELVRSGKGVPQAVDNSLARMIAQLVVHCQDDLRARMKEIVQTALAERVVAEFPGSIDRNFEKTKQAIAQAIRDEARRSDGKLRSRPGPE
jgi:hypothetical protein